MKKGISFYFGYNDENSHEERVKLIKDAGFDCVITIANKNRKKQNGSIRNQMKNFKKYNLLNSSLHMRYTNDELPEFFIDGKIGKRMERDLKRDVALAKKYHCSCVVVHLFCKEPSREIGFERIKRVLKFCQKKNIPLAIENIDDPDTFKAIFKEIEHPYMKICYDSGHNNFVDPEFDYFKDYGDKIICLHLHDNSGKDDEHTLNKYGTIDWQKLAEKLAKVPNELVLDYEIFMAKRGNEDRTEVLAEVYKQACQLEEMIKNCKNQNK